MTNGNCKPKRFFEDFATMTSKGPELDLCFGSEEEYLEAEVHSPTDSSEDSVEVKVSPICLRNKRKCAEPRKVKDVFTAPPKKRMCFKTNKSDISNNTDNPEPFRPWNDDKNNLVSKDTRVPDTINSITNDKNNSQNRFDSKFLVPQPPVAVVLPTQRLLFKSDYDHHVSNPSPMDAAIRPSSPSSPLPLVKKNPPVNSKEQNLLKCDTVTIKREPDSLTFCDALNLRVPVHPQIANLNSIEADNLMRTSAEAFPHLLNSGHFKEEPSTSGRKEQRNYKNMTRERRIEANARERTRVHTISAAFETLRKSVPAYSHNQKLSKLSVLRIACSYIMTLSSIVNDEELSGQPTTAQCVESVSRTIQKEGKLRKKKDDSD